MSFKLVIWVLERAHISWNSSFSELQYFQLDHKVNNANTKICEMKQTNHSETRNKIGFIWPKVEKLMHDKEQNYLKWKFEINFFLRNEWKLAIQHNNPNCNFGCRVNSKVRNLYNFLLWFSYSIDNHYHTKQNKLLHQWYYRCLVLNFHWSIQWQKFHSAWIWWAMLESWSQCWDLCDTIQRLANQDFS